ncbi:MAG: pyridoxal-phosphate-dependent aminotransferase family protein [Bacilli bacterium]
MKLFCPGPVNVSENVINSISNIQIGHRSKDFEDLFKNIKANILKLSKADSSYDCVILSSSGSSANESVIASLFTSKDKILILSNGSFGERIAKMVNSYKLNYHILTTEWGSDLNLENLQKHLQANSYDYLFVSHDETSSGLLNPITELGLMCKQYNIKFFVDCVSSLASDEVDIQKQNISIMTAVSGKALGGLPGASIVVMKKYLFDKTMVNKVQSSYLNLANYYDFSINKNQTPNTPNITSFISLDVALKECVKTSKQPRYIECSNYLRDEFELLNIAFVIERFKMSNTVTTIILPKEIPAKKMYDKLYQNGFTTYLTRGVFEEMNCLQVCVMGEIYLEDCKKFIEVFKSLL